MVRSLNGRLSLIAITALLSALAAGWLCNLEAAIVTLSWADNSSNENGFEIQRKIGTYGTFSQRAIVGVNVKSYVDIGLPGATTFCYRVRAFNSAGSSAFTPEGCKTTPGGAPTFDFSLAHGGNKSVTRGQSVSNVITATLISGSSHSVFFLTSGLPTGATVSYATSNSCNPTCSRNLNIATSSSTPTGTYPITVTGTGAGVAKIATFNLTVTSPASPSTFTLNVNVVKTITSNGSGNGAVTSSPNGINCGTDCSQTYSNGAVVKLIATPVSGSVFGGWSGNADCQDGAVTMNANIACTATFNPLASGLTVGKSGSGTGTVKSSPAGINCGSDCNEPFAAGTSVNLTPTPAAGSVFKGWSGGQCGQTSSCTVVVSGSTSVTAFFDDAVPDTAKIGIYRPSTGEFFLDRNGNGLWDGCKVDICLKWLAQKSAVPVAGNWDGGDTTRIGTFDAATGAWYLDRNGNGRWDGCAVDVCITSFGKPGDIPVVGYPKDWEDPVIGIFRSAVITKVKGQNKVTDRGIWQFDANKNGVYDGCGVDYCVSKFGHPGDFAVAGDWDGSGGDKMGIFEADGSTWRLDYNGNGVMDGCNADRCLSSFGRAGDLPVAGDWDDTGKARIGVFRPSTGEWFLDKNGNGRIDGCTADICVAAFGKAGDRPVVGKW